MHSDSMLYYGQGFWPLDLPALGVRVILKHQKTVARFFIIDEDLEVETAGYRALHRVAAC